MTAGNHADGKIPAAFTPIDTGSGNSDAIVRMLAATRLFGGLTRPEMQQLAGYLQAFSVKKDMAIFSEGNPAGFMCIIVEGRVRVYKDTGRGESRILADLGPGASVGEMSVFDNMPRSASAAAVEPVIVLVLKRPDLDRLLAEQPRLGAQVLWKLGQLVSRRLRQTSNQLVDFLD